MNTGIQKADAQMPPEMIAIIEQVFGESSELRQNLVGQLLGIITGTGPKTWVPEVEATPGHYITRITPGVPGQATDDRAGGRTWKVGQPPPGQAEQVWVPGTPERGGRWEDSGDPGMQIPIIAQAQEQQRRATSQAMTQTEGQLAQRGLVGTPFGENILAQMGQQGRQQVAGVEQNILQQFLQMIPGMVTGNIQSIMGALPGTRESDSFGFQLGIGG
jgi:hypothetical protein